MLKQIVKVSERGSVHLLLILLLYCAMYMQVVIGAIEYLTLALLFSPNCVFGTWVEGQKIDWNPHEFPTFA